MGSFQYMHDKLEGRPFHVVLENGHEVCQSLLESEFLPQKRAAPLTGVPGPAKYTKVLQT